MCWGVCLCVPACLRVGVYLEQGCVYVSENIKVSVKGTAFAFLQSKHNIFLFFLVNPFLTASAVNLFPVFFYCLLKNNEI